MFNAAGHKYENMKLALYLHFPYCEYKCHYCDFNSYVFEVNDRLEKDYVQALKGEWLKIVSQLKPFQLSSLFFGGGTPSLFSASSYQEIFDFLRPCFSEAVEVSLEANPKSLSEEKIKAYQTLGVNRFSVGVQSFKEAYLKPLGRLHSAQEARQTLGLFEKLQVSSFNIDLMYGFPGQTLEEVEDDLSEALSFQPEHLSFYQLTLEEGTRFYKEQQEGKWILPDPETLADMHQLGEKILGESAYSHYEISNYAKNSRYAQHNLAYWNYENYVGLGAGAVSFLNKNCFKEVYPDTELYGLRWTNPKAPREYQLKAKEDFSAKKVEQINIETALKEAWMMGLRLEQGISWKSLSEKFRQKDLEKSLKNVNKLLQKGWLQQEGENLFIPSKYRLITNEIVAEFF
ncbi:MAG: radical SAM family heme chaperone HemW [Deltaproteobacteria bacterium]|nr:radical SAM family heme chaperone HemW [Deltaproteobacteria bacterium]